MKYCNGQKWGAKKHVLAFSMYPLSRQITFGINGGLFCEEKTLTENDATWKVDLFSTHRVHLFQNPSQSNIGNVWQHKHLQKKQISDDRTDTCCSQEKALRRVLLVLFGVAVNFIGTFLTFLAVHNRSIGDLVTNWLTQSLTFTFDITERPKRLVTFETFDQSDQETWPDQHFDNFQQFSTIFNNFQQF